MTRQLNRTALLCLGVALLVPLSPTAMASDDLGVTMRMVTDDDALTDSVVREIRLNRPIGLDAEPGQSARGMAKEAREQGRAFGQEAAERAREAGRLRDGRPETPGAGKPEIDRPQPNR